jgi:molybdopterin converting factor small subunit
MRVRAFTSVRDLLGAGDLEIAAGEGTPLRRVLRELAAQHPALNAKLWDSAERPTGQIRLLLNGRSLDTASGFDTLVSDADTLGLFAPLGGG